jgi:hypothetical protein
MGTGIFTAFQYNKKTIGYKANWLPLLLERVGVRRIKSRNYMPLIPAFPATTPALPYYPYSCR